MEHFHIDHDSELNNHDCQLLVFDQCHILQPEHECVAPSERPSKLKRRPLGQARFLSAEAKKPDQFKCSLLLN